MPGGTHKGILRARGLLHIPGKGDVFINVLSPELEARREQFLGARLIGNAQLFEEHVAGDRAQGTKAQWRTVIDFYPDLRLTEAGLELRLYPNHPQVETCEFLLPLEGGAGFICVQRTTLTGHDSS